jgi:hypothetical protein
MHILCQGKNSLNIGISCYQPLEKMAKFDTLLPRFVPFVGLRFERYPSIPFEISCGEIGMKKGGWENVQSLKL